MSAAEHQQQYRTRHLVEGMEERLSVVVSANVKRRLERMARHYDLPQRAILEGAIIAAELRVLEGRWRLQGRTC